MKVSLVLDYVTTGLGQHIHKEGLEALEHGGTTGVDKVQDGSVFGFKIF